MRYLGLGAAALVLLSPSVAAAASHPWQLATATSVTAGVNSKSTFVIDAYVTLPMSCYVTRIMTYKITQGLHRSFAVYQQQPAGMCTGPAYKCTVSQTFMLPIQSPFEVYTKGKEWPVHLGMHAPTPMEPMCHKG
jgi:hypothetical protein